MLVASRARQSWTILLGLMCLGGCASTAEVNQLRAEVARANAEADKATAEVARLKNEIESVKRDKAMATPPKCGDEAAEDCGLRVSGYKWGAQSSDME